MKALPKGTVRLGLLARPFGVQGEIRVQLDSAIQELGEIEVVYVEQSGTYLPWFVRDLKDHQDEAIRLWLEDIDSPEEARDLCGKDAWVSEQDVTLFDTHAYSDWVGFTLLDQDRKAVGAITDIIEMPHQALAEVTFEAKSVLIPLVDSTILEVDRDKSHIVVEIADGLLDL